MLVIPGGLPLKPGRLDTDEKQVIQTHPTAGAERLAAALRAGAPPVVVRVADDRVLVDLRTVDPADQVELGAAIATAVRIAAGAAPRTVK